MVIKEDFQKKQLVRKLIYFSAQSLKIMQLKELKMVDLLASFMLIKKHIKDCVMKLSILTWEVNIKTNTKKELIKYGNILIISEKVISLLQKYHKL
jgi:hypothetical protein